MAEKLNIVCFYNECSTDNSIAGEKPMIWFRRMSLNICFQGRTILVGELRSHTGDENRAFWRSPGPTDASHMSNPLVQYIQRSQAHTRGTRL